MDDGSRESGTLHSTSWILSWDASFLFSVERRVPSAQRKLARFVGNLQNALPSLMHFYALYLVARRSQ